MTCTITITGEATLHGPIPREVLREIQQDNSFPNPKYAKLQAMGFWAGNVPKTLCLSSGNVEQMTFPRTYAQTAVGILRERGIPCNIQWHTYPRPEDPASPVVPQATVDELMNKTLFGYQREAVTKLLRSPNGLIMAPTGSGKTSMISAVIASKNLPAVVLLHTKGLLDQTKKELERFLGIEVGILGAGKWIPQPVSVGMYQTLYKRDASDPIFKQFGLIFCDEVQTVAANTFQDVTRKFNALYRYGCSATPSRKDGLTRMIHDIIGKIVSKVSVDTVINAGRIMWPDVEVIPTEFWYPYKESTQWTDMMTKLAEDARRNLQIATKARGLLEDNPDARIVILCERINQVEMLADILVNQAPVKLHGKQTPLLQRAGWEAVRNGARLTIATYSICGVGINVPGWEILLLASPIMGGGKYLQVLGRITRVAPGKDRALLLDFVDKRIPPLVHGFKQRKKLYADREAVD